MSSFQIRPYEPNDHNSVLNLHRVALKDAGAYYESGAWDSDLLDIENAYFRNGGTFLVGIFGGQIVAMGALRRVSQYRGEIKRMRVMPELQRRGFGKAILTALEEEARKKGYQVLVLDTTIVQVAAQQLYLKNGYAEVSRMKKGFPLETIFYEKQLFSECDDDFRG